MNTYSYAGSECFWHVHAANKNEAIDLLRKEGENANKNNVKLLSKGWL